MLKFLLEILNYPNNGTTPRAYIYPLNKKSQIAGKKNHESQTNPKVKLNLKSHSTQPL